MRYNTFSMKLYYSHTTDIRARKLHTTDQKIHTRHAIQACQCGFFMACFSQSHRSYMHLKTGVHKKSQQLLATALKFNFKTDNPNQH